MGIAFIGDYYFEYTNQGKYEKNEEEIMRMMAKYFEFYGQFQKENEYVTSGSLLWCTRGSKLTKFDVPIDHAVFNDTSPFGIDTDSKVDLNIYSFGCCSVTTTKGHPIRKSVTVDQNSMRIHEREMCIPLLNESWKRQGGEDLKIYDYSDKKYHDVLSTGAFLTCLYGGIIKVVEVQQKQVITRDWLRLYSEPTVSGSGRHVQKHPKANNYDWGMPEKLKGDVFETDSMASKMIKTNGGILIANKASNNVYIDADDRYWIAVGPNVMNPSHKSNAKVTAEEMNYGTKIDIHVTGQHDGKDYYIPAVVGDAKAHSKPDGLYQTGIPFDPADNDPGHADGSTVEFIGYNIKTYIDKNQNKKSTVNYTNDYKLIELIVYDSNYDY